MFWPYLKTFLVFVCFVLPPDLLSPSKREHILMFADMWAKLAFINYYFTSLFNNVFYFTVHVMGLQVDLYVQPQPIFYTGIFMCFIYFGTQYIVKACANTLS